MAIIGTNEPQFRTMYVSGNAEYLDHRGEEKGWPVGTYFITQTDRKIREFVAEKLPLSPSGYTAVIETKKDLLKSNYFYQPFRFFGGNRLDLQITIYDNETNEGIATCAMHGSTSEYLLLDNQELVDNCLKRIPTFFNGSSLRIAPPVEKRPTEILTRNREAIETYIRDNLLAGNYEVEIRFDSVTRGMFDIEDSWYVSLHILPEDRSSNLQAASCLVPLKDRSDDGLDKSIKKCIDKLELDPTFGSEVEKPSIFLQAWRGIQFFYESL